jgi:8-hydroxy-5-deazaflavin:NADPH oxidoreductase
MKFAILGTGSVGQSIASKLAGLGHEVTIGTRDVKVKLASSDKDSYGNPPFKEWLSANNKVKLGTFAESAQSGEIIINATHGGSSLEVLKQAGAKNLSGKILIDIANPLDFSKGMPPSLLPGLSNTNSLGEEIQKSFPETKVVKTLNTMWCGLMVNPNMIGGGDHINYISGNDADARKEVRKILKQFGWKDESLLDLGDITAARATESILPIWLRVWSVTQNGAFNFRLIK